MSQSLLARVAQAERQDPGRVRPVLQVLVGDRPRTVCSLRPVSGLLNQARLGAAREEFVASAVTTDHVLHALPGVSTRQGVHRLRDRGRLLGRTIGNATYFPSWQFGADGDLRPDLGQILELLGRFTGDAVAADRVMRLPRVELGGAGLAEALDDPGRAELAWRLLGAVGGGD